MGKFATYTRPVEILTEEGWKTFDSVKELAAYIGVAQGTLSTSLIRDLPCKGHKVRYHQND